MSLVGSVRVFITRECGGLALQASPLNQNPESQSLYL